MRWQSCSKPAGCSLPRAATRPVLAAVIIVASLIAASSRAQPSDPLGSLDQFSIPPPTPSVDTALRSFVMNGQRFDIPRNFIESIEKKNDGSPGAISLRATLPDLSGLTRETLDCLNRQNACSEQVVTIGLLSNKAVVPGSRVLENIRSFTLPEKFSGPCDLDFYETIGNESQRSRYFFKKMVGEADISVLWCAKEGSSFAPTCASNHNLIDQITFYYNFSRKFICEWEGIRSKIRNRIKSFTGGC
jgi:hypothetical protein